MTARRRRRGRGRLAGLGVLLGLLAVAILAGHAVVGSVPTAFLLGVIAGAGIVLGITRPRLSLRVSIRGTRPRPLRGGTAWGMPRSAPGPRSGPRG